VKKVLGGFEGSRPSARRPPGPLRCSAGRERQVRYCGGAVVRAVRREVVSVVVREAVRDAACAGEACARDATARVRYGRVYAAAMLMLFPAAALHSPALPSSPRAARSAARCLRYAMPCVYSSRFHTCAARATGEQGAAAECVPSSEVRCVRVWWCAVW